MSARALTASVIAVFTLASAPVASAADLGEGYPPGAEAPYDDSRYGGYDRQPPGYYNEDDEGDGGRYSYEPDDEGAPYPRHGSFKDGPYPPLPPRFGDAPRRGAELCIPRWQIRHRLRAEGWSGLHRLDLAGEVAIVQAYRPSGRLFELKVDRCTGEVIAARPARLRHFGSYEPGPERYDRDY